MPISDAIKTVSEPANKLLVPLASAAGSTLQDIWDLVFGSFGSYVEKKRIVRARDLENFRASLLDKVSAIPEERLCEPPLSIVGPALEASKYYFEEPDLREMFAKLIAASMDSEKAPAIHPSFTEIIRHLSPLDAQNLTYFTGPASFKQILPLGEYRVKALSDKSYKVVQTNLFLSNPKEQSLTRQAVSIANLARLGLAETTFERYLIDKSLYEPFEQTKEYRDILDYCSREEDQTPTMKKGEVFLTPMGEAFCAICISGEVGQVVG